MFCKNCGTQIKEGGRFCPECGTPVAATPVSPAPKAAPGAGSTVHTAQAPRATASAGVKTKMTYQEKAAQRRKNSPYNQVGKYFTFAHFLTLICCVAVVVALFLPNRSAGLSGIIEDHSSLKSPSVVSITADRVERVFNDINEGNTDDSDFNKALWTAFYSSFIVLILIGDAIYVFNASLMKRDFAAVTGAASMALGMGLTIWMCHGSLKGSAGYLTLLISSLAALIFSIGGYIMNLNQPKQ